MKTKLLKLSVLIIVTILIYAFASFISWDYNPDNWNGWLRFIIAIIWISFTFNLIID